MLVGELPALIGFPGVFVAIEIGVTVEVVPSSVELRWRPLDHQAAF
jgi:hypothetical protein